MINHFGLLVSQNQTNCNKSGFDQLKKISNDFRCNGWVRVCVICYGSLSFFFFIIIISFGK